MVFIYMNMKKTCWKYCLVCKYLKCKRNWIRWILILIGILVIASLIIILLIVLPTTLITTFHIHFGCLNTDFTNTGQIGDTIGGITAPIIGLISIGLLYITFKEQREFNKKQVEFNKEQNKFNDTLLEFDRKQLELNHYTSFITLLDVITQKLYFIKLTYKDGTYSIGLDDILASKEKLNNIDSCELKHLKEHLKYSQRLIRTFLRTNKDAQLNEHVKVTFYKVIKDIADKMLEIYELIGMGQSTSQKTWAQELMECLENCNPEK